jgi:hypothetical protein
MARRSSAQCPYHVNLEIQRYDKSGESRLERQTELVPGCPHDCEFAPEPAQHTCLGIIGVDTADRAGRSSAS